MAEPNNGNEKALTKIQKRIENDKKKVLEFLGEHANVSLACKRAGISRETFYRWRDNEEFDTDVRVALMAGAHAINDLAQHKLVGKINDGDIKAITFHLEHRHPDYNGEDPDEKTDSRPVTVINLIPYTGPERNYFPDRSLIENDVPKRRPDVDGSDITPDDIIGNKFP